MARKAHIASDSEVRNEEFSLDNTTRPANSTRAAKTRSGFSRGITGRLVNEAKVRKFEENLNTSRLDIPDEVRERFESEGYHIGWVRYLTDLNGNEDHANIFRKCNRMGFQFIDETEVPEMALGYKSATVKGNSGVLVTEGDLALAKIPQEDYDAIMEAKARKVARVSQGILGGVDRPKGIKTQQSSVITKGLRKSAELADEAADVLDQE